jgi:hypothetical protein
MHSKTGTRIEYCEPEQTFGIIWNWRGRTTTKYGILFKVKGLEQRKINVGHVLQ